VGASLRVRLAEAAIGTEFLLFLYTVGEALAKSSASV